MSLQGLISASECAVPANPLSQVLKHTEGDRSVQQDRIAGPSSGRLHHLPGSSSAAVAADHDIAMARQFFEAHPQGLMPGQAPAMLPALGGPQPDGGAAMAYNDVWLREQQMHFQAMEESRAKTAGGASSWASEFGSGSQMAAMPSSAVARPMQPDYQRPTYMNAGASSAFGGMSYGMGMYGMNMSQPMFQAGPMLNQSADVKGKGKGREADFEAAFDQIAASFPAQGRTESARIVEVDDEGKALNESATLNLPPETLEEQGIEGLTEAMKNLSSRAEYEEMWKQGQSSMTDQDRAKWESEFNELLNNQRDEFDQDYSADIQKMWESGLGNYENPLDTLPTFDTDGYPILGEYAFETQNKYLDPSASSTPGRSHLEEAKELLKANGSLTEVALLLEAAIQKGEYGLGGYEAWILLGETRNMDEREDAGMRALTEGVRRAEANGDNVAGKLSLAISYTNESYDRASHGMLLRWLQARFPHHEVAAETIEAVKSHSSWDAHTRLTETFIDLARTQHAQNMLDPDVQNALGVLFFTNQQYEHAKDCFESALSVKPQDFLLWNRLGSCLSNGNKPEEALSAYREALNLRPTYTRAISNVGIACLNMGAHKEAAEHFLSALAMQESTDGEKSEQLWSTLRRVFHTMARPDLVKMTQPATRAPLQAFRPEFDF